MDFREGGRWLYAMVSPENIFHWSLVNFVKIEAKSSFISRNSFSDENGNPLNTGFTSSLTETYFKAGTETTTVQIVKKMASLAELEQFIARGFKEGVAVTLITLENLLTTLSKQKKQLTSRQVRLATQ